MSKHYNGNLKFLLTGVIALVGAIILYIINQPKELVLFKKQVNPAFILDSYSDKEEGGNSTIRITDTVGVLKYKYDLGNAYDYPFVGVYFQDKNYDLYDYSSYQFIHIKFNNPIPTLFNFTFEKYLESNSKSQTYRYDLKTTKNKLDYKIPIHAFKTPEWWFKENVNVDAYSEWVPNKIVSFNINNQIKYSKPVEISEIVLRQNVNYTAIIIWMFLNLSVVVFMIIKNKKTSQKQVFELKLDALNQNKVTYYIHENFANRNLSIPVVAQHLNIDPDDVEEEVVNATGRKFKDLVNFLRVELAKKLLIETDEKSFEIALKAGFNNAANFSQVFKSLTGTTPNKYRKLNQNK